MLFGHCSNFKSDDTFLFDYFTCKILYIYKCKIQKNIPQFHLFKRYLKSAFEVEKHTALVNMSYDKFVIDWHFYKDLIETQIMICQPCFIMQTAPTQARTEAHTGTCKETKTKLYKLQALPSVVCLSIYCLSVDLSVYLYRVSFLFD